jgi:hypothetical protein
MNTNNINKQQKLVGREEKILQQKQNKPGTLLEITKRRTMYAPASRRFDRWSPWRDSDQEIVCLLLIDKTRTTDKPIYECRCDERLKLKGEESTCLAYTGLLGK